MKAQTLIVLASALAGVLAAPLREREAAPRVVTVYENVVHVVTTTKTIWVKPAPKTVPAAKPKPVVEDKGDNYPPEKPKEPVVLAPKPVVEEKGNDDVPEEQKPKKPAAVTPKPPASTPAVKKPQPKPKPVVVAPPPKPVVTKPVETPTPSPSSPPKDIVESVPEGGNEGSAGSKQGEATFYNTGLGSCGITSSDSEYVVAISHVLMDASSTGNPNNNPLCG